MMMCCHMTYIIMRLQVKLVLEGMGLQQYGTVVQVETLDGAIFCELDEDTLTQELGIASKIHRLKVLKLINGQYDSRTYMPNTAV